VYLYLRGRIPAASVRASLTDDPWPSRPPSIPPATVEGKLDDFWGKFLSYSCIGFPPVLDDWQTIGEMTAAADIVVVAKPSGIEYRWDPQYGENVTVIVFHVDEVLHGSPMSRLGGDIEVVSYGKVDAPVDIVTAIPHVLFLKSLAKDEGSVGRPVSDDDKYSYFTDAAFQNVLANVNGKVYIPLYDRAGDEWSLYYPLPAILQGFSFDKVIQQVLDAPTGTSALRFGLTRRGYFAC
jgi:hypothetical protein